MSTAKRTRSRQQDAGASANLHPAKRAKLQDQSNSLAFLTDERQRAGKKLTAKPTNGIETSRRFDRVVVPKTITSGQDAAAASQDEDEEDAEDDEAVDAGSESSEEPSSESDAENDGVEIVDERLITNGVTNHHDDEDENMDDTTELPNGHDTSKQVALTNGIDRDEEMEEDTGPSFGDMLQEAHPDVIDVSAAFQDSTSKAIVPAGNSKVLQAPSATSLATVLSQALRTNDKELLESCLQTKDLASIKSTIQRLQSPLVATLMQKLAERLHKRPGRAGPLMVWVQWALVAHGGYLATQPQVVRKLRALRAVIRERSNSLQSLIVLKGKLDMLSAQVELRRGMRAQRAYQDESDDDEADIVYVEGAENDPFSSDEEGDELPAMSGQLHASKPVKAIREGTIEGSEEEMDGDIPLINGIDDDAEVESLDEEDDASQPEGLIDDEAEESEDEESISSEEDASGSDSDDDEEDADGSESSEDDAVAAAPPKPGRPVKRNTLIRKR